MRDSLFVRATGLAALVALGLASSATAGTFGYRKAITLSGVVGGPHARAFPQDCLRFFDLAVTCETVNGKKRRLTIKAGKNHRFTIPEEKIE